MFDDRRRDDDDEDRDLEFLNRTEERLSAALDDAARAPAGEPGDLPDDNDDGPWRAPAPVTGVRRRSGRSGRGLFAVVMVALVAMLAFVFWPRGRFELPPPVGEQTSVVTTDAPGLPYDPSRPVSGDVDLAQEAPAVVPETPGGRAARDGAVNRVAAGDEPTAQDPAAAAAADSPTGAATVPPGASGDWAIQLGAFGQPANAQDLVTRLRSAGHRIETETVKTAGGASLTRVRVAWFRSEAEAAAWAAAHAADLGRDLKITSR
jgi:cell division septation protein DedD